jgi:hypothetical protein
VGRSSASPPAHPSQPSLGGPAAGRVAQLLAQPSPSCRPSRTSGLGSSLTRWYGWEWDSFGLACVELYDLYNPFVDHTLRIIKPNGVVLAYNFNVVILVLIIGESCIGAFLLIILL